MGERGRSPWTRPAGCGFPAGAPSRTLDTNDLGFDALLAQFGLHVNGLVARFQRPQAHAVDGAADLLALGDAGGLADVSCMISPFKSFILV